MVDALVLELIQQYTNSVVESPYTDTLNDHLIQNACSIDDWE